MLHMFRIKSNPQWLYQAYLSGALKAMKKSFAELIPDGAILPDDEVVHLGLDVVHL
jgi:hypothetical protein